MINVIVPIVNKLEEYQKFFESVKSDNVHFFVGVQEGVELKPSKNMEVHVFQGKPKKEDMINGLHSSKMEKGKIIVVRRLLSEQEFSALVNSKKEIAVFKKTRNKFCTAILNFWVRLIQSLFAFSYFSDISAVAYGENLFELLSVCPNLSMASRVNKYVGVEIEEIESQTKSVEKEYSRTKNWLLLALWAFVFVGSVIGGVLVCVYTKVRALTVVFVIAWMFLALMALLVELLAFTRAITIGDLHVEKTVEIAVLKEEVSTPEPEQEKKPRKSSAKKAAQKKVTTKEAAKVEAKSTKPATKKASTTKKAAPKTASKVATEKTTTKPKTAKTTGVKKAVRGQNKNKEEKK